MRDVNITGRKTNYYNINDINKQILNDCYNYEKE